MLKGTILLWTDVPIEAQILGNFLRVEGYNVENFHSVYGNDNFQTVHGDLAILVVDDARINLRESCRQVRRLTQQAKLPILTILSSAPDETLENVRVMVRPIRLSELVKDVRQLMTPAKLKEFTSPRVQAARYPYRNSSYQTQKYFGRHSR